MQFNEDELQFDDVSGKRTIASAIVVHKYLYLLHKTKLFSFNN